MKIIHIPVTAKICKLEFDVSKLPDKVGLVTTVQHTNDLDRISAYLEKKGIIAVIGGQVLGCDAAAAETIADKVDAYLYVGTGIFHPINVGLQTGKTVYTLNPESMTVERIDNKDIEKIQKKKKGMLAKFHSSKNIGVLLTTKPGQSSVQGGMEKIIKIEKRYPDKKFYHFLCDTLDYGSLENFQFIQCWVNTMCPRIMEDINILNITDL